MSALWTAAEAAQATGGQNSADWLASGVSIDTRTIKPGDLFVALKDSRDGHDFVAQALNRRAAAALVSHRPDSLPKDAPLLMVDDVLSALNALAQAARARSSARIVAITGSVGKTSTKDMLRSALAGQGRVHASADSYNNHWGVPLTLARMPADAEFAVIEIGMNHPGEIAPLAQLTRPHVALVTNVAAVHMAAFDDLDGIAREKAAIFDGLTTDGVAVINADLPVTEILVNAARAKAATILRFGIAKDAGFRLGQVRLSPDTTVVQATHGSEALLFKIRSPGAHFAMNGLGALAAAQALGADLAVAACDLANWTPPAGRGARETVVLDVVDSHLRLTLLDDAYNASPISMDAALQVLAASPRAADGRGRRIAILGDMLELGAHEDQAHADLAQLPAMAGVDMVHCAGPRMAALFSALPDNKRGERCKSAPELAARVHKLVRAGDVILVKGSKGSQISLVVQAIRKLGQPMARQLQGTN